MEQSRSQDIVLHGRASSTVLHICPPLDGLVKMLRVCPCTPPSQSAVHFDQPDHSDMSQLTGHFNWLHFLNRAKSGHLRPQLSGGTTIFRVICCQPPHEYGSRGSGQASSQETEHSLGTHASKSQSSIDADGHTVLVSRTALRTTIIAHIS